MPTIDLGRVKGDTGVSMRSKGAWTPSTAYVSNSQYIDVVTNGGNSYSCKTSHTSGTTFSSENWNLVAQKGAKGDKGDTGNTPTIKAGTATSLESSASPTVSATTSGDTTTFNFGIPKGDTSKFETPTFTDTVSTYTTLNAANTAAETASNAIKSKVSIFTTLSNMKKSFSAIVQGLKILATNVGAINGITSDINSESTSIAASSKMVHDLNSNLLAMNAFTLLTATWNTGIVTNYQYCGLYKIGKMALLNIAIECKAIQPWKDYKLCDITNTGFSFAHDVQAILGDQNNDSVVTIVCNVEHPKSIYLKTFETAHALTWYRGFILVPCTN